MRNSSFHTIIKKLLDLIFPPSDQERRFRKLSSTELRSISTDRHSDKHFIRAICDYRDETVREVVYGLKFDGSMAAADIIAQCIHAEILAICQQRRIFDNQLVITSVPMSPGQRRKRGFNQSHRICKQIIETDSADIFCYRTLLKKVRTTADQTELTKDERRKNVRGVFEATVKSTNTQTIFVIDDVTTTGATLTETRRALRKVTDADIIGIAFAH
jgi:ComF family protein